MKPISIFIGVDPGKAGGIAALNAGGGIETLQAIPLKKRKGGTDYDVWAIAEIMGSLTRGRHHLVVVEKMTGPPVGSAAIMARGEAKGWLWLCAGMYISAITVPPATWQKVMLGPGPAGTTKERSIACVKAMWPNVDLRRTKRSKLEHDGFADALMLARYGQQLSASAEERAAA